MKIKKIIAILLLLPMTSGVTNTFGAEQTGINNTNNPGVIFETAGDTIPEIISGQYPAEYNHEKIQLQTIVLKEESAGTWSLGHESIFYLDENVKLRGAEISTKGIDNGAVSNLILINNGKDDSYTNGIATWEISDKAVTGLNLTRKNNEKLEITLTLWVSVHINYKEDIQVTVRNREMQLSVVAGKGVLPVICSAEPTHTWRGKNFYLGDIFITENDAGQLPASGIDEDSELDYSKCLLIGMEAEYFDNINVEVIEGDIEIGRIRIRSAGEHLEIDGIGDMIIIEIKKESTIPSTIKISELRGTYMYYLPKGYHPLRIGGIISENGKVYNESPYATFENSFIRLERYLYDKVELEEAKIEVTNGEPIMKINNFDFELTSLPYIEGNTLMVPAAEFFQHLDHMCWEVYFYQDAEEHIKISSQDIKGILYFGDSKIFVNGNPVEMPVGAVIRNGVVYIPFKAIGEMHDVAIQWNADTMTATFN